MPNIQPSAGTTPSPRAQTATHTQTDTTQPERAPATQNGGALRLLVVEDDADVAELATEALRTLGYAVMWAANATLALELLGQHEAQDGGEHGGFDLVFSDIVMPGGISGVELAARLRQRWPGLPVVLATGYTPPTLGVDALRVPVLIKPYSLRELSRVIAGLLRGPEAAALPG